MLRFARLKAKFSTFIEQFFVHAANTSGEKMIFLKEIIINTNFLIYHSALFMTPLNSNKEETVLVGVSAAILEKIINYAYLRDVSCINESNVVEIMMTADFMGVPGLTKHCIDFIIKILSPKNCIIYWLMSR